ncbi:MAG: M28 family peptidase, partial [Anaeroplasmataceae bacterium]|nr:M28 family peptidase [Anaeroplasmataceae bacterium]
NYSSFEFLKKLAFERVAGSEEELKAANIIVTECHKYQVEAHLEDFEIDGYNIKEATLETTDGTFYVTGVGMSGSTLADGIVGELIYIQSDEQIEAYASLEGKIVLIHGRMLAKTYQLLASKKTLGFICVSGSLYDDEKLTDLEELRLRERHYQFGKIPGVCIRMTDAQRLILSKPQEVRIIVLQEEFKTISHNVVATIPGSSKKDKIICFTAHYDSVRFSTGAYDNASGSATIMELLTYFSLNKPSRTLKFIWCGSEEIGLQGSKAYLKQHEEEVDKIKLCINVDMTGVVIGSDIACCTTPSGLVHYINYLGLELGFPIVAKEGVYSSDSSSFADQGIPALSFARIAPKGGEEIHSRKDVLDFLDSENYYQTADFILEFSKRMVESVFFPVERLIPEELKKELDIYFGRKERTK